MLGAVSEADFQEDFRLETEAKPIPALGLRTYRLQGRQLADYLRDGLEIGYRHIDTAQSYGNEAQVGQAIEASGVAREELFLTTKLGVQHLTKEGLIPALRNSLRSLKTERVDLTLLHGPVYEDAGLVAEALAALREAQRQGLTRRIGAANLTLAQMRQAVAALGASAIATHQIELDPWTQAAPVVAAARSHGIRLTAYQPLFRHPACRDPVVDEIARRHGASATQVSLAWLLQKGCSVLPSATARACLWQNWSAQFLRLTGQEMRAIDRLGEADPAAGADLAPVWY